VLGRWTAPDRSSEVSEQRPGRNKVPPLRGEGFEAELEPIANRKLSVELITDLSNGREISKTELSVVKVL
jgi:hypothetical protein